MIQLKYKDEFLDIAPGQDTELTKNSPLFLVDNVLAEYSTPFQINYTDKNARLLGFMFFEPTVKALTSYNVEIYSNGTFRSSATLMIESAGMNRRFSSNSNIAGYVLTGISDFFQQIQTKLLTDLVLGGDRVMNFTTEDPTDGTDGYWQAFQKTWDFNDDYVVVPCLNEAADFMNGGPIAFLFTPGWMNKLDDNNNLYTKTPAIPFPKFLYVLNQCFAENGWTLDTSALEGTFWERLIMFSCYYVVTGEMRQGSGGTGILDLYWYDHPTVTLNLSLAMPQTMQISTFILEACKRYGWIPICDGNTKTCKLIALKDQGKKTPKDWTKYADVTSTSQFQTAARIFSFKTDFEGSDSLPSAPDFTGFTIQRALSLNSLPTATAAYDNIIFLTYLENKYYNVTVDSTTGARSWSAYSDNIYDDDDGLNDATDTFETKCSTLPMNKNIFKTVSGVDYYGLFPACNNQISGTWGLRTMLYLGMVKETKSDDTAGPDSYPMAGSIHRSMTDDADFPWSNVYLHSTEDGSEEFGLVKYWWQNWINILDSPENQIVRNFYLPLHELINYSWDDVIMVNNIPYLIISYVEPLEYKGVIQATMQRISLSTS